MKVGKFLSKYLKTADVKEAITVTISSAEAETIGREDDRSEKLVVYFEELDQGVVLGSKEALAQVIDICESDDTDDWVGKKLVLFNDKAVAFKGKRCGGLRFRAVAE